VAEEFESDNLMIATSIYSKLNLIEEQMSDGSENENTLNKLNLT
jgi:hypothetical protein